MSEICYFDYKKLIFKQAHCWSRYGFEFEELVSEGNMVFCDCLSSYDPDESCFSTYLFCCLNQRFHNMVRQNKSFQELPIHLPYQAQQEKLSIFSDLLSQMGQDAKMVCKIIFETPLDLINQVMAKGRKQRVKICKSDIKKYLVSEGWVPFHVEKAFAEIEKTLAK